MIYFSCFFVSYFLKALIQNINLKLSKYGIRDEAIECVMIEEIILEYLDRISHFLTKGCIVVLIIIHNNEPNFAFSNENTILYL